MNITKPQFIVYACPTGELNTQLETYFQLSKEQCGANNAHNYMPHCTLTGFFTDRLSSADYYLQALEEAYKNSPKGLASRHDRALEIEIKQLVFNPEWHGLELQAEAIKDLIKDFVRLETSPTRQENIRLKDWLHLSLAYGFESGDRAKLEMLARETINLAADVAWELRFYQRVAGNWNCLKAWSL